MSSAEPLAALAPHLDSRIDAILAASRVPGAAVALVRGGRCFVKTWGTEGLGSQAPVGPLTGFDLGSCAKSYVAAAVALLAADGRLRFDEPVQTYLPEFELDDPGLSREVTIRDLLCNRIGLRRQVPVESFANQDISALEVIRRVRKLDRVRPFRGGYVYFNPGFMAARLIVERVSGVDYGTFLDQAVLGPLGMRATASGCDRVRRLGARAQGHVLDAGEILRIGDTYYDNWQGAAGVFSCACDATRWLEFQLRGGMPRGVLAETHRPHTEIPRGERKLIHAPPEAERVDYCMGWWATTLHGRRLVQHAGEMFGWRAHMAMLPEEGTGVAVMLSLAVPRHHVIAYTVLETLLTGNSRDWMSIADDMAAAQRIALQRELDAGFSPGEGSSLPFGAYAGIYEHPACGAVQVDEGSGCLELRVIDGQIWDMTLESVGGHVFRGKFTNPAVRDYAVVPPPLRFLVEGGRPVALIDTNATYRRVS